MAKQLGVKRVISRVSKILNLSLFEKVGVDIALSYKMAALNEVKNFLCGNNVGILTTVEQGKGEVLEITLPENFESIKVMDLKLPAKAVIGVVRRRNRVIIPNGITQLMSCDNLIVLTTSENAQLIKDYFKGKECQ